jgi:hypothetical protein
VFVVLLLGRIREYEYYVSMNLGCSSNPDAVCVALYAVFYLSVACYFV